MEMHTETGMRGVKPHPHSLDKLDKSENPEAELRNTVSHLLRMQERERAEIAEDLHDKAGQTMTVLCLLLGQAKSFASSEGVSYLQQAHDTVMDLASELRSLSLRLRPGVLDDIGLLPALQWDLQDISTRTGIRTSIDHKGLDNELPPDVKTTAYRIVQEALDIISRQAKADMVEVFVEAGSSTLHLELRAAGSEFNTEKASSDRDGWGVINERARALNGQFKLESSEETGLQVVATLPLAQRPSGIFESSQPSHSSEQSPDTCHPPR